LLLASLSRIIQFLRERQEHTQVKHLSGAPLKVRLLTLSRNNGPGWKGLPGANTLAYYENYGHKKFYIIGPCLGWIAQGNLDHAVPKTFASVKKLKFTPQKSFIGFATAHSHFFVIKLPPKLPTPFLSVFFYKC
jgi:hypothetical protein